MFYLTCPIGILGVWSAVGLSFLQVVLCNNDSHQICVERAWPNLACGQAPRGAFPSLSNACHANLVPRVLSYPLSLRRAGRREPWERGCCHTGYRNYASGILNSNSPVTPRRQSCQISANQREVETSANVNKHWKPRVKGNDVITNVISANQHLASTFPMQIFKF